MTIDEAIDYTETIANKFEQYFKDMKDIYDKIPSDDWSVLFTMTDIEEIIGEVPEPKFFTKIIKANQ